MCVIELFVLCTLAMVVTTCIYLVGSMISEDQ